MSISLIICAIIVLVVAAICFFQNRIYMIPTRKLIISIVVMVVSGLFGICALSYIELGVWAGKSFCGCIFVAPFALFLLSKIIKIPFNALMDMSGPVCSIFLALIKINCYYVDCCEGIILKEYGEGSFLRFPSQIVEGIVGAILCIMLLRVQKEIKNRGCIAPMFLILFGVSRFALNFFREKPRAFRYLMRIGISIPPGHLWSAICLIWGIIWMYRTRTKTYGRKMTMKEFIQTGFGIRLLRSDEE